MEVLEQKNNTCNLGNLLDLYEEQDYETKIVTNPRYRGFDMPKLDFVGRMIGTGKAKLSEIDGVEKVYCGEFKKAYTCKCGNTIRVKRYSCGRIQCPVCHTDYVRKQAGKIYGRLEAMGANRFSHYSVNPDRKAKDYEYKFVPKTKVDLIRIRKRIKLEIQSIGVKNAMITCHAVKPLWENDDPETKNQLGLKAEVHWHIITDGSFIGDPDEKDKKKNLSDINRYTNVFYDWKLIYHRSEDIGDTPEERQDYYDDCIALISYPLTHCHIFPSSKCYTYLGQMTKYNITHNDTAIVIPQCKNIKCESVLYLAYAEVLEGKRHPYLDREFNSLERRYSVLDGKEKKRYWGLYTNHCAIKIRISGYDEHEFYSYKIERYEAVKRKKKRKKDLLDDVKFVDQISEFVT